MLFASALPKTSKKKKSEKKVKKKANHQEKLIGRVERQTNIGNKGNSRKWYLTKGRV